MDSQELQPGKEVSSTYEVENIFYDFFTNNLKALAKYKSPPL